MNELLQQIFNLEDPIGKAIVDWIQILFWIGVGNYIIHIVRLGYESVCLIHVKNYIKNNHGLGEISPDLLNNLANLQSPVQASVLASFTDEYVI